MSQTPAKDRRKEEKDNIFLEILSNIFVQIPAIIITWIVSKIDWE